MTADTLAKTICEELVYGVFERRDTRYLVTRFQYPDGDFVPVYVEVGNVLSDRGTTLFKLQTEGLEITQQREEVIQAICLTYGIRMDDGALMVSATDNPPQAFLSLCEAVTRISTLIYDRRVRRSQTLGEQIGRLLDERVAPKRAVYRDWCANDFDPRTAFPVDFRINTVGTPRHIFHVSNSEKSDKVAAVGTFMQLHGLFVPTLTIVSEMARLPEKHRDRLAMVSTEIRHNGLAGNEDFLVEFALNTR